MIYVIFVINYRQLKIITNNKNYIKINIIFRH